MPFRAARIFFRRGRAYPADGAIATNQRSGKSALRLSWVWTTGTHPDCNLGDALSAVIVSAISHLPVTRAGFGLKSERLAAVGTIGHAFHLGKVHLWGTGFDMSRDWTGALEGYKVPRETELVAHAVRGRRTAAALRERGIDVPEAYGDPVWFLPKVFPATVAKEYELGVVVHISELTEPTAASLVRSTIERYKIAPEFAGRIRIINTYTPASVPGLRLKLNELLSCRRILSTSLHGLVIAEAYGIPCAWFATHQGNSGRLPIDGEQAIDHRLKDFYSGANRSDVLSYLQPLNVATDWDNAIGFIDDHWRPLEYTGEALFNAFPLRSRVRFESEQWDIPPGLLESIPY
ncbi:polysaccharide pyruvyl transferase family protein [Sinorhizobium meliloti]|uniref:polysaccharide pyruvyl transferase family protein n=1 Tax=Rhizobium meliloti TaxID=382 RepID=UPI000FD87455|nr:polysaccharide pyruvyl transferase family protein [Sinorhizobium meliloti]RVK62329.1 polysaccharide pyruvyl transferase family protein [Sinorhizobium meliloti]